MRKEQIVKYIKSRPGLYYAYKCLNGLRDKEFVRDVLRMNECDLILNFKSYGDLYPEKNIYYIKNDSDVRGFFSLFFLILDALVDADRYGLTPVVELGQHTLYYQGTEINGSRNPFEYYFEPVSEIRPEEINQCSRVLLYKDGQRNKDYNQPFSVAAQMISNELTKNEYIASQVKVYRKYIKLKPQVQSYIDKNLADIFREEKRLLGIHVRGTDFHKGYLNHAKAVSVGQYLDEAAKAMDSGKFDGIFLATDEENAVSVFKSRFGDRVRYYGDTLRSATGEALHFTENIRVNHKYLLGLEVLRDALTLASCDGLIAGLSNVSLAAHVMKLAGNTEFDYLQIIDNGFNENGVRFERSSKKG